MIRHCDGNDPNLIAADGHSPCECGLRFDDVRRLVIWPHRLIPSRAEKQAILDGLLAAHANCPATCEIGRVARLTDSNGEPPARPADRPPSAHAWRTALQLAQGIDPFDPVPRCRHGNPPGCVRCAIIITGV